MQTQKQLSATDRVSQGALVAQKRLLALLRRIDQSAQVIAAFGNSNGELDRLYQRRKGIVEALKRLDKLVTKILVSRNLRCPQCCHHSVTIHLQRGRVVSGKAVCEHCGFRVEAARLKNGIIAKCPKCNGVATIAQGKREDGSIFFAFACNRCDWVLERRYRQAERIALRELLLASSDDDAENETDWEVSEDENEATEWR
jgi:DNA-directed RNA polymerase subunit M/transcription elongation factor TFIIS